MDELRLRGVSDQYGVRIDVVKVKDGKVVNQRGVDFRADGWRESLKDGLLMLHANTGVQVSPALAEALVLGGKVLTITVRDWEGGTDIARDKQAAMGVLSDECAITLPAQTLRSLFNG